MLGPQFDHTYWHEDGELIQMPKGTVMGQERGVQRVERIQPRADTSNPLEWMNEGRRAKGIQGSLFSPYVGTGLKEDPTVPAHVRESHARMALGSMSNEDGPKLTETLVNSDMPTHVMRDMWQRGDLAYSSVHEDMGGNHSGEYWGGLKSVRVRDSKDTYTLTHELGHASDPDSDGIWNHQVKKGRGYDPVREGLADGRADRYSTRDYHPDTDPDAAARQASRTQFSGYTNKAFGDDLDQALYTSARHISMSSDQGVRSLPSREALFDDRFGSYNPSKPNGGLFQGHPDLPVQDRDPDKRLMRSMDKILMGHIVENHPKALSTLNEDQMAAAKGAHEYYQRTAPRSFFDHPGEEYHQEKLL